VAPRSDLAAILAALALEAIVDVNIYAAPPAILATPALVIRPDSPWRDLSEQLPFGRIGERYAVVAVVNAGADPGDSVDQLRALVVMVENVQDANPWKWSETTGIVQSAEGGIDYLAATVRLTYMEG
jgi:hypothetical protein